ncbi:MAG: HAD family hydrolase [Methanocorpusculum sp.]|nr:HAD family hydrolase [Methanocorpusculum sp.]
MSPYKAVLFDMDNTLHSLYDARFAAADCVMAYKGVFPDLHLFSLNRDNPTLLEKSVGQYISENNLNGEAECIWLYKAAELFCVREYEGMREVLNTLKNAGVKLAVISNADPISSKKRLESLEFTEFFDIVVSPETFGVKKPDPQVYIKTIEALGVSANECAMIGDRIDRDVTPPRELGIFGIHAWYGSLDEKDSVCYVNRPEEILRVLGLEPVQ